MSKDELSYFFKWEIQTGLNWKKKFKLYQKLKLEFLICDSIIK